MKIIEKKDDSITFTVEMNETLANAIRRYVNHIPTIAVDEVEIFKNDSPLYDETVAHRIGLIPLKLEKSTKKNPKLKLSTKKEGFALSEELKGEIEPVYGNMPITYLNNGQELEITATTESGRGIEHSKFSPGLMFYRNASEIILDKELADEVKKSCDNEIKQKGNKIIVVDDLKKEVGEICEEISKKHGKTPEVGLTDDLVVTVESFGQIKAEDIFKKSIEELKKDLNEFSKKI